jgi:hypothetical protein
MAAAAVVVVLLLLKGRKIIEFSCLHLFSAPLFRHRPAHYGCTQFSTGEGERRDERTGP